MSGVAYAQDPFTRGWIDWIRENLGLGVALPEMVAAMTREGIEEQTAIAMIKTLKAARLVTVESNDRSREKKMEWILDSIARNDRLGSGEILNRETLGKEEFYETFYFRNQPVVLTDWREREALRQELSWKTLAEKYGELEVEIQDGRSGDRRYERNSNNYKRIVKFQEFLDQVLSENENNDAYLTANNGDYNREVFSSVTESSEWMPEFLNKENFSGKAFLWIGPKGTVTQLHHDLTNNLLLQVSGRKLVSLFPPSYFTRIYNDFHCYSDFDCEDPDFERFPLAEGINIRQFVLEEGQALFIPVGWWHQVRSLSPSISLTAVNFFYENDFEKRYTTYHSIS